MKEGFNAMAEIVPFHMILDKTEIKYIERQAVEEGTIVSCKVNETKELTAGLIS